MNVIKIYWIGKKQKDDYLNLENHFLKISSKFAKIEDVPIFNKEIAKKQNLGNTQEIQNSYSEALQKYLSQETFNIVLNPNGKTVSTEKFADLLNQHSKINFFIGGAFGLPHEFTKLNNFNLSLTPLTMSHKIAKLVLFEQIYRGLSINNNQKYHK